MAETYQNTPLNADNVAADVDRKQNQRLAIASFASVATNILFLIGAANGMNEKPLSLEQAPPVYVTFTAVATPAPIESVAPVPTPAPKQVVKAEPLPTPAPRRPKVANTPPPRKPRVQVARVRPTVKPRVQREVTPPREITPRETEPTPPPVRPVEETIAETRQQKIEANQTRGAETQVAASGANTNADSRRNASRASDSPSNAGASASAASGSRSRVAQGVAGASATNPGDFRSPSANRNNASGAPSLRTGIAGGSDAAGTSGIVGETRATGSIIGSAGNISGPSLANSTGPRRGVGGGLSGARDKILTQSQSAGGAASGDFTVAKGTGLRPGAIVARTGPAAGGAAGTLSNATLGARISGGGNGSGSGGAESLGVFRRSTGLGGGSNGPVGLRVGTGPGAGRGTGAMSGVANGDPGGVSGQGLAGGNGVPGRGAARSNGAGGGSGTGIGGGSPRGGNGNGIGDDIGGNGKGTGRGNGTGPGASGKGVVGRNDGGVGSGRSGTGTGSGEFGVKGGVGNGANINSKGTGTATGVQGAAVDIAARGGGGAGIVTQKVGQQENRNGNGPIQVKSDDTPDTRKVAAPSAKGLSNKVDQAGFDAKENARATRSPRPRITEEMKAAAQRSAVVEFTIGANGSASARLTTSSGNADVDAAVMAAANGWRWKAATSGGTPVASKQIITFNPNE